jgi:hypothetical protein
MRNYQWLSAGYDKKNHLMFSLTNNGMFTVTKKAYNCIYGNSTHEYGRVFGGGHDLVIRSKAN